MPKKKKKTTAKKQTKRKRKPKKPKLKQPGRKPTALQKRIVKEIAKGKPKRQAGKDAGSKSPTAEQTVTAALNSPYVKTYFGEILDEVGATDEKIAKTIDAALGAKKSNKYEIDVDDNQARIPAARLATQLKGHLVEKREVSTKDDISSVAARKLVAEACVIAQKWYSKRNGTLRPVPENILKEAEVLDVGR